MAEAVRRVVMVIFPDVQVLDAVGPLEVFSTAARYLRVAHGVEVSYEVGVVAREAGPVRASSGVEIVAGCALRSLRSPFDTLIVAGGEGVDPALGDRSLLAALRRAAPRARRLASVCTGALLLAEAGLLDGRRATTHWLACRRLARRYPRVEVDPDAIFVRDGSVYTSAGVTAGMDLALALLEEDWGARVALDVARLLVLFVKRPGGQSQFSAALAAQHARRAPLRELQTWILEHLSADLSVAQLARRTGMSPRNFARAFAREVGQTPARFVEQTRVEAARRRLEDGAESLDEVAASCGFGSAETLRRAFHRTLRVAPSAYRARFESPARRRRAAGRRRHGARPRRAQRANSTRREQA